MRCRAFGAKCVPTIDALEMRSFRLSNIPDSSADSKTCEFRIRIVHNLLLKNMLFIVTEWYYCCSISLAILIALLILAIIFED